MRSYIKGGVSDFYSPNEIGIDDEKVGIEDNEDCVSELEWNYLFRFSLAYDSAVSKSYIDGFVVANDEYQARAKIMKKYTGMKYENVEIRHIKMVDIIELSQN